MNNYLFIQKDLIEILIALFLSGFGLWMCIFISWE